MYTRVEIDKKIALGIDDEDDWGLTPGDVLDLELKGLSLGSAGEDAIEYYFNFFDEFIDWLHEKDCEDIRVPLIESFFPRSLEITINDLVHKLTRYFALRIIYTYGDEMDLIALHGHDLIITPDSMVWVNSEIEEFDSMDYLYTLVTPFIDPTALKSQLGRVNKALEHINLTGEEFELVAVWTGWFENYILSKNPEMAKNIQFIRAFNREIIKDGKKFEQTFGVDYHDFQRDYKEQLQRERVL